MSRPSGIDTGDVLAGVVVDVGGVALALRADDAARADAVASLFRHAARAERAADATVRFAVAREPVPDTRPATVTPSALLWRPQPDTLAVRTDGGLTVTATPSAVVVGGDGPGLARGFRFAALLGLTHLLARHDRHLLHGAALAVDGMVLVVLGAATTGKSTLAFAAHRLGWGVIADDAVLARVTPDGAEVCGVPRPIAVAADVVGTLAEGRPVPEDLRARVELPPGTLEPGARVATALAVATGADPRGPGLDPLGGVDALRAVLRASISLADPDVRPRLFALAGELARLPGRALRRGGDPAVALADATAQLEALHRHFVTGS